MKHKQTLDKLSQAFGPGGCPVPPPVEAWPLRRGDPPACPACGGFHGVIVEEVVVETRADLDAMLAAEAAGGHRA